MLCIEVHGQVVLLGQVEMSLENLDLASLISTVKPFEVETTVTNRNNFAWRCILDEHV